MLPNHHITKPVFIGEVRADGQFDVVWKTPGLVAGRRVVEGARRLQGPGRRLGRQEVRQLEHQDQQVRQLTRALLICYASEAAVTPPPPLECRGREQFECCRANASSRSYSLSACSSPGRSARMPRQCAGLRGGARGLHQGLASTIPTARSARSRRAATRSRCDVIQALQDGRLAIRAATRSSSATRPARCSTPRPASRRRARPPI